MCESEKKSIRSIRNENKNNKFKQIIIKSWIKKKVIEKKKMNKEAKTIILLIQIWYKALWYDFTFSEYSF